ncbi:hypothetical protein [Streptomyces sp. B6B3]|uniref:hypothetical protein n=1 Tax=Streptomyces sp. B6B3 TaxID=3153570 RepID=UPI00325CD520
MRSRTRRMVLAVPVLTVALLSAAATPALADNHVDDATDRHTATVTPDDNWPKDVWPKVP